MATADKLNKLLETKAAIKQAIRDKGVYIGDYDAFAEYPDAIRRIETSSGGSGETYENPDFYEIRTEGGTNYSYLFASCSGLTELDLSNFNTSNVTTMSNMFYSCSNLAELNLSNFNTGNVTYMNWMFYGCSYLKSLDLSNFDTSNVTDMNRMFYGCIYLHTLRLDNCNNDTINKIITSPNFPTNAIEGVTRKIYVKQENAAGLAAPTNWIFEYVE